MYRFYTASCTRHVQKVSSDRAYRPRRWRERGALARWCLRSREGYIRHIVNSHSLIISSSFCLEMSMKIENPASCEIRSVIKFLNAKNVCTAEIYQKVCEVCGENARLCLTQVDRWRHSVSDVVEYVTTDKVTRICFNILAVFIRQWDNSSRHNHAPLSLCAVILVDYSLVWSFLIERKNEHLL
jgi:hypothetical protein